MQYHAVDHFQFRLKLLDKRRKRPLIHCRSALLDADCADIQTQAPLETPSKTNTGLMSITSISGNFSMNLGYSSPKPYGYY
jgi:hypothetical protein